VSERELYPKARRLLADEIGHVRGIELSRADDWIEKPTRARDVPVARAAAIRGEH
jgi:hypothetical protein